MVDDLIKPVDNQSIISITSAKDREKKKRQNSQKHHDQVEEVTEDEIVENTVDNKDKNSLDFCA